MACQVTSSHSRKPVCSPTLTPVPLKQRTKGGFRRPKVRHRIDSNSSGKLPSSSSYDRLESEVGSRGLPEMDLDGDDAKKRGATCPWRSVRGVLRSLFEPADNKLAMKLFGNRNALMKERQRQRAANSWVIHPCSDFRSVRNDADNFTERIVQLSLFIPSRDKCLQAHDRSATRVSRGPSAIAELLVKMAAVRHLDFFKFDFLNS